MPTPRALAMKKLRWHCPLNRLDFKSTASLHPLQKVIGQGSALDALQFGLSSKIQEHHVFVRGLSGTGRSTLVKKLLRELRMECPPLHDRCYVHNFSQPDQPRLLTLAAGQGGVFRLHMKRLAAFVQTGLREILTSDTVTARRKALEKTAEQKMQALVQPFEKALAADGLSLVTVRTETMAEKAIFPLVKGEAVVPEEFDRLHAEGTISDAQYKRVNAKRLRYEKELEHLHEKAGEIREAFSEQVEALFRGTVQQALHRRLHLVRRAFPEKAIQEWLDELLNDLMELRLPQLGSDTSFTSLYRVNVVVDRSGASACPVVVESTPTLSNLVGSINLEFTANQEPRASHMGICAGSLLQADGGYLILEARDLLSDPEAWKYLVRTLRTGSLEVHPPDSMGPWPGPGLKPQSVDIEVKVVLLGDTQIYYFLDEFDPNFRDLFKVLADFEETIPNDRAGARDYARWVSRFVREENLPHFSRKGVAALIEHGVRVAADGGRITARFGRMADLVREAGWLASRENANLVRDTHVKEAIRRRKSRADHPSRRFRRQIAEGTIRISTTGKQVGQVNGLAVISAGNMTYGFPARITATIGPGTAGMINIDRESALSGAIHTKGFYILGGLLRHLLRTEHPLAFDASVAFEQSYGGIDGDSASGAETCCLLSALTDIPLRQEVAMTGAIDQMGNIMAIGAVNEKIEGFFDTCADQGLNGSQGVIIPQANADDLQLREDVVKACAEGRFAVWAVKTVHEALQVFTGMPAGKRNAKGRYPQGTVLYEAMQKALEFWEKAVGAPSAAGSSKAKS